jgi:hypothetical protein
MVRGSDNILEIVGSILSSIVKKKILEIVGLALWIIVGLLLYPSPIRSCVYDVAYIRLV